MITIRKSEERGHFDLGWLDTYHSFSFDQYYDPAHMHFRSLRVINEDRVQPGQGFPTHSHRDMEIITYILSGALEHRDSLGTGSLIRPGDVQRMTAGTGVTHSEFNPSTTEPVHFLQIWITPEEQDLEPSYEQRTFLPADLRGGLKLLGAKGGRDGVVSIHQDVKVFASRPAAGTRIVHKLSPGRHAWIQIVEGALDLNDHSVSTGDGAAVSDEVELRLDAKTDSHFLLLELA